MSDTAATPAAIRTAVLTSVMQGVPCYVWSEGDQTCVSVSLHTADKARAVITGMGYTPDERPMRREVVFTIPAGQLAA